MAEKADGEGGQEAKASRAQESYLDQFLRRLDQPDQEGAASPSTSGTTMAALSPSSEYSSLASSANPWSFTGHPGSPLNPDFQTQAALQSLMYNRSSVASPYSLPAIPLAEFPWLLEEFDNQQRLIAGDSDAHESAQRLYSSYSQLEPQGDLGGASPSSSQGGLLIKDEPAASTHTKSRRVEGSSSAHAGHSGSKLDAGPVPRFGDPGSAQSQLAGASSPSLVVNKQRPHPASPLLSDATAAGGAAGAGSVTTSAGTSNTSLSSESTSNAGDDDEGEVKKEVGEGASGGKRKKPEAEAKGAGETSESKKSDQPKNKPRKRGGAKRLREPRYAIKTRTDVDVLDDGFKWRKYGQKAVKNSPHPRNYYRCTTPLCPVRKRVERSNEDAGLVITTYEGTHTHQTPGFHRPSGGFFGDRPLGLGGGLFQSPLGPGSPLLPLPPGFDLASLQQATALRNIRSGLQPNQNLNQNLLPGSSSNQQQQQQQQQQQALRNLGLQQESLFRAQQFLGLQDPTSSPFGGPVKQEPSFQFNAQEFLSRNLSMGSLPGLPPSPLLRSSLSDHVAMQRPGGSPLFTGLNLLPNLRPSSGGMNISGPASSSNITSSDRAQQPRHHEIQPGGGSGGGSSSRIDQTLEILLSGSPGHPNFTDQAQGGAGPEIQPQPGRSSQITGPTPPLQHHQHQHQHQHPHQHQHQHQHQHITRPGAATGGLSSRTVSSENLQGSESETGAREGLLQDMVRHGGPKVSKS